MRFKKNRGQENVPPNEVENQHPKTVKETEIMRDKEPVSGIGAVGGSDETVLSSDVEFKGSLKFKNNLRIDGKFEGDITSPGMLHIGESGQLKGEISVGDASVEGKIHGNIVAGGKVELRSTAQLFGDVKAARLVINEGVTFVGKCDVNPSSSKIEALNPVSQPSKPQKEHAEPIGASGSE
jgi:cytoskeletal protein CcmA (bactofilin family)